jgi:hypothetical protein
MNFLVFERFKVFGYKCGFTGSGSQNDGSSLIGEFNGLDFAMNLMILEGKAKYIFDDFAESGRIRGIESRVESLIKCMVNSFFLFAIKLLML